MGSPGAGKTVVGRILSERLGLPLLDIDDDWLERVWGMPVSAKAREAIARHWDMHVIMNG